MKIFIDSSALIKLIVTEPGSQEVQQFMAERIVEENHIFVTAPITKSEVKAGLAAMRRGGHLSKPKFESAVIKVRELWKFFFVPEVTTALIDNSGELGLNHKLKGCDAFQLASALESRTDVFISTDKDLNAAVSAKGLMVWNPTTEPIPTV